jgi:hypothetical protein
MTAQPAKRSNFSQAQGVDVEIVGRFVGMRFVPFNTARHPVGSLPKRLHLSADRAREETGRRAWR